MLACILCTSVNRLELELESTYKQCNVENKMGKRCLDVRLQVVLGS